MTFLILSSIPIQSGTGIRISHMARSLCRQGHAVTLTGIGQRPERLEEVRYIEIPFAKNRALALIFSLAVNFAFSATQRPDVVIASKTLPNSVLPVWFGLFKKRMKILDLDDLEYGYWVGTWLEPLLKFTDRLFTLPFDKIAVHTEELKEYAVQDLKISGEKIISLNQGVSFAFFQNRERTVRKRLGLEKKKVILYTAHLGAAAKGGLEFIFRGCRTIFEEIDNICLLVVGSGDRLSQYKFLSSKMGMEKKVFFTGGVRYQEMPDYFAAADVSVNYLDDTEANRCRSSIKVRESLAAGVPVVCNLVGSDLLRFREHLYAYATGSSEDFSEKLKDALYHPDEKRTEEGKNLIREQWDWDVITNGFLKEISYDIR